ncbi:NUC173-domain-containing protein [Choiromyces venosus 120613-1]|uniref:NUC173-domain-containing protein n=1 Tax=Choiromyces venosus 120613-1 TaxID=1336337 RepID=A0A3N4K0V8_9PEZI|nr:NUC173-domain-containing protein [Choiromyces venosus 120613-1]
MSLEAKLEKIRSPNLQNQRQVAVVLSAVEDILREQKTEFTPTAYFAALLSLLQQATSTSAVLNKDLAASTVYLLDLVTPFAPVPLLRSKFQQILSHLVPALTAQDAEAPLLRSSIGCLESLLVAQDGPAWAIPQRDIGPRRALTGLLNLGLDDRPKVRKRAHEAITKVLKNSPPSPSLDHPAAEMCATITLQSVADLAKASEGQSKKNGEHDPRVIHSLQLIKAVAGAGGWPSKKVEGLCEVLLGVSKSTNEYIMMAAFGVFEEMFANLVDGMASAKLPRVIEVISELQPSQNDSQLLPSWLAVIARGYEVYAQVSEEEAFMKLPSLFETIAAFLDSQAYNIRTSAAQCLISLATNCIPDSSLFDITRSTENIFKKVTATTTDLLSVRFQGAWNQVFDILSALLDKLRWRSTPLLDEAVKVIGGLRSNESFQGKKEADEVLGRAIRAMGPDTVLVVLPLNLIKPAPSSPGRAWMLPILRDWVENAKLQHFRKEFVPLSEAFFQKVVDFGEEKEKTVEIKIFETLVGQIWALLPGYCDLPLDLTEAFDQSFAELIANVLYQKVDLRSDICKALQQLVDSNKAVLEVPLEDGEENLVAQHRVSKADAKKNIAHLASFSGNLLAVLFNVYSTTLPQYRGFILKCLNSFLSITPDAELMATFQKVTSMLETTLAEPVKKKSETEAPGNTKMPPMAHTLMDLVITITPYLPSGSHQTLFTIFSVTVNKSEDPQLQKKAYKVIPRLAETDPGKQALIGKSEDLQNFLIQAAEKATPPARRDRLAALSRLVEFLPTTDLHFIPSILSEVVISAKEVNEKARTAAFDLLVLMGEKMKSGGTLINSKVAHMPEDAPNVAATLDEYITMVSAGLAGSTPHMISASITALTRILYQFKDDINKNLIAEMITTLDLFLTSKNREIVRSVLGFVKVCIISLPKDIMLPRFNTLVPNLVVWSHEHKAHFKAKVKHIIERMIRRFGYEAIEKHVPEEDKKLVINIRKTRERRKRHKDAATAAAAANGDEGGDEEEAEAAPKAKRQSKFASEFEAAIYDSDSEVSSDSDADADSAPRRKNKRGSKSGEAYIHEEEDEPLDLLDRRSMANISSTRPQRTRIGDLKKSAMSKAKTNKDGKLILGGDDNKDGDGGDDEDVDMSTGLTPADSVNAYVQAITGKDAFVRGQRGRVKYSNKKGRHNDDDDDGDEEMEVDTEQKSGKGGYSSTGGSGGKKKKLGKEMSGRKGLGVKSVHDGRVGKSPKRKGRR